MVESFETVGALRYPIRFSIANNEGLLECGSHADAVQDVVVASCRVLYLENIHAYFVVKRVGSWC